MDRRLLKSKLGPRQNKTENHLVQAAKQVCMFIICIMNSESGHHIVGSSKFKDLSNSGILSESHFSHILLFFFFSQFTLW